MPASVRYGERAIGDLKAISDWIADHSDEDVARRYVLRIMARCEKLGYFPNRGSPRETIMADARSISFERRIAIFYRVDADGVVIERIVHNARDLGRVFSAD